MITNSQIFNMLDEMIETNRKAREAFKRGYASRRGSQDVESCIRFGFDRAYEVHPNVHIEDVAKWAQQCETAYMDYMREWRESDKVMSHTFDGSLVAIIQS